MIDFWSLLLSIIFAIWIHSQRGKTLRLLKSLTEVKAFQEPPAHSFLRNLKLEAIELSDCGEVSLVIGLPANGNSGGLAIGFSSHYML